MWYAGQEDEVLEGMEVDLELGFPSRKNQVQSVNPNNSPTSFPYPTPYPHSEMNGNNKKENGDSGLQSEVKEGKETVRQFFKTRSCYDLLAQSNKIVILDSKLSVKSAFYALVENDIQSAPLWDSEEQKIVGMLTGRDFVNLFRHLYYTRTFSADQFLSTPLNFTSNLSNDTSNAIPSSTNTNFMKILEAISIKLWRDKIPPLHKDLIWVGVGSDLFKAARQLVDNNINRLPVCDGEQDCVVYTITRFRILKYVFLNLSQKPSFMKYSVKELGIGTYENIATVTLSTPLISVLDLFAERRFSAVPIVDDSGGLVDLFSRTDLPFLSASKDLYLDMPVGQVISVTRGPSNLPLFTKEESLESVLDKMVNFRKGHLLCIDMNEGSTPNKVSGIISLNDILRFFINST